MNDLIKRYLMNFPRGPEGEGAGGGAGAGAGGEGGSASGGTGAGGEGGGAGGAGGSGAAAPPSGPYFPEGLPDNLKGANEKDTLDRVAKALKGYRERDAGRDVPDQPEKYLSLEGVDEKVFKPDATFTGHLKMMAEDPGMKAGLAILQKAGVDRGVVLNALQSTLGALSEAGMLEPMIDEKAERAALLPEAAKNLPPAEQDKAIDKRMQENQDFVALMSENRGLDKDVGEYAQLMLSDSAKGHKFLEWMRGQIQGGGEGPGAHGGGQGRGDTSESLRAEQAKPELTAGHPSFDAAKYADFEVRYKKFHSGKQ